MANDIMKLDNADSLVKRKEVDRGDPQALAALDLAPKSLRDVRDMAVIIAESGLGPEAWRNPNAGVVMLITAMEMGLTIGQAWRGMYSVKGMPAMGSGLVLAMVRSHRECEYFRVVEASPERATCQTKRRSEPEPASVTYTIQQAKDAGLLGKENWRNHPEDMLVSKAVLRLARRVYQDVLYGFSSKEELEDEVAAPVSSTSVSQIVDSVPEQPPKAPPAELPQKTEEPPKPTRTRRSNAKAPAEPPPPPPPPPASPPQTTPDPNDERPEAAEASASCPSPVASPAPDGLYPEWEKKMRAAKTVEDLDDAAASASLDFNAPNEECDRVYIEAMSLLQRK